MKIFEMLKSVIEGDAPESAPKSQMPYSQQDFLAMLAKQPKN
jgi:hypothetical protein